MKHQPLCRLLALTLTLGSALALPALAQSPASSDTVHYLEGRALAPSNGKLLYTESHWNADSGTPTSVVLYRCPDGKAFARKRVQDITNAQAPNFTLDDARSGYQEGVRGSGGDRTVFVQEHSHARERTASLSKDPALVIDGGFDAFVRAHWDSLKPGTDERLHFLVPAKLKAMDFKLSRTADATVDGVPARRYRLSLDSWIGFALPHIEVAYDAQSKRLLDYSGLTNMRTAKGDNVSAHIVFKPGNEKTLDRAALEKALSEPLDGRCSL